ncbi:MAG: hypothetical protein A3E98_02270 [Candidatus Doudnabacteria bacterium RIFCSPHIGHO2_12_FULL_48_11]|uniref:TrpR like protein, YerC/YecD n=1 Tax=Candidatus Doudnabacteria bacterium RIFCSPHIGHO2_01_FULL_46_24 TaxID=1817825 RepID=A0A1F5NU37_9BACT|nr:MAG: hypothetical protein A2720_01390 [Candidatus Doudnabacteria bacterium RIFCSPHIGHO2_01_FULL_46_24]OGE96052.1 MAG: hypothetical protein A3E98_02270 [Candidatus Doudnabacteria bacterium RIFCSPHIGHO2_12_FULL_48_11]
MTKISRRPVDPELMGNYVSNLWSIFAMIRDKEEIKLLFKDLFTHTEYKMFAKRLEIVHRLLAGETYQSIMNHLKVTERTISTVSNILERAGKGFRAAEQKLLELERIFQQKRTERQNRLERRNLWYKGGRL